MSVTHTAIFRQFMKRKSMLALARKHHKTIKEIEAIVRKKGHYRPWIGRKFLES